MILSDTAIVFALDHGYITIDPSPKGLVGHPPFNPSSIDLHLSNQVSVPHTDRPLALDLSLPDITAYLKANSDRYTITDTQPYTLQRNQFVLANTTEQISFPINPDGPCYAARVEGRSSLARCGILVHFTAPTIHAGFFGTITLELINLGFASFLLKPGLAVCQLVIEEVQGVPTSGPSQFAGQSEPEGR